MEIRLVSDKSVAKRIKLLREALRRYKAIKPVNIDYTSVLKRLMEESKKRRKKR